MNTTTIPHRWSSTKRPGLIPTKYTGFPRPLILRKLISHDLFLYPDRGYDCIATATSPRCVEHVSNLMRRVSLYIQEAASLFMKCIPARTFRERFLFAKKWRM